MKKNYNYNELVRSYNRSVKKLSNLLALDKNEYKQNILRRRIARLFQLLTGMQTQLKLSTAIVALTSGFVLFQPNAASAQTFAPQVKNPFSLVATPALWSTPWFVDLDNDGDKDIMAGTVSGDFYYYQNTGTVSAPSFSASVKNPFGLANTGGNYSSPVFVDLDNDGDKDMVSGDISGVIYYFQNTGTASSPSFTAGLTDPYGITTISATYSAGSFIDLDNDGDMDFMSGDRSGNFHYFPNIGTVSVPNFGTDQTNAFGLTANLTGGYSTVTFADLDGDGDQDLWSGDGGAFNYYLNTGTVSAPVFAAPVNNPFALSAISSGSTGATSSFGDLDGDLDLDLISGDAGGNFFYFQNSSPLGIPKIEETGIVTIYPNPTSSNVSLKLNNTAEALNVQVTNVLGQEVSSSVIHNTINIVELPEVKGIYFVKVTDKANKSNIFKVLKN